MAKLTLCGNNRDVSDEIFTIELTNPSEIQTFISLVEHGGKGAGLFVPSIKIVGNGREQNVSHHNNWQFDRSAL